MRNRQMAEAIALAKQSHTTVLMLGKTGTGKTTLAEQIHREGPRAKGPFVSVNLAALHEATIEATLFGHERGAFTGADRARVGRLELANGGTVFFDEIGELSLSLQARLLEFLQTKTLTPIGSNRERRIEVRVICATHRNLEDDVRNGLFREDLLHRIRVLTIELESLAELPPLEFSEAIHRSLEYVCRKLDKTVRGIDKEVAELFECYSWPGNFRELESVLEVSVLACREGTIAKADLPHWFVSGAKKSAEYRLEDAVVVSTTRAGRQMLSTGELPMGRSYESNLRKFESAMIRLYLERNQGCFAKAARDAGLPKATFYRKAQFHRITAN